MNIRFYNARILPLVDGSLELVEGELWVQGNRIAYVGPRRPENPEPFRTAWFPTWICAISDSRTCTTASKLLGSEMVTAGCAKELGNGPSRLRAETIPSMGAVTCSGVEPAVFRPERDSK